jgi:hypothetical protein
MLDDVDWPPLSQNSPELPKQEFGVRASRVHVNVTRDRLNSANRFSYAVIVVVSTEKVPVHGVNLRLH